MDEKQLIQIWVPKEIIDQIDEKVKQKKYENRSHFVRSAINRELEEKL